MKTIYSTHHFIFAFSWNYMPKNSILKNVDFDQRTDLSKIDTILKELTKWKNITKLEHCEDFNHWSYFYDYVRKSIYDFGEKDAIVKYYEYDLTQFKDDNRVYKISYYEKLNSNSVKKNEKEYQVKSLLLDIAGITLHLFSTGAGIVSFDLQNTLESQKDKSSILKINEFGRRIYPQFLGENLVQNTKRAMLADSITVELANGKGPFVEDFSFFSKANNIENNCEIQLPLFIAEIF